MKLATIGFLFIVLCSCSSKEQNKPQIAAYFNVKNYFEKEAARLDNLHRPIQKTVVINGVAETKQIKIESFSDELGTFINSDINKASWRGSFTVKKASNLELYHTDNEKIPVKNVQIQYKNNSVKSIQIIVSTTNILYHSIDTLNYYPDSLYEIKKTQKIRLIEEKRYSVIGKF